MKRNTDQYGLSSVEKLKIINSPNYALKAQSSTLTLFLFCGKPKYLLIRFLRKLEIEPQL